MKYIFTFVFLILMSGTLCAEQISLMPKPVPAPTSFLAVMEIEQNESLSSRSAKNELKDLATRLKQNKALLAYVITHERSAHSKEALRVANQIKNFLIEKKGIISDRIVIVQGGYDKTPKITNDNFPKIRIYLVPQEKPVEDSTEQVLEPSKVSKYRTEQKAIFSG